MAYLQIKGYYTKIICDKDKESVSEFWKFLFKLCGWKLGMRFVYHLEKKMENWKEPIGVSKTCSRMYIEKIKNNLGISGCIL